MGDLKEKRRILANRWPQEKCRTAAWQMVDTTGSNPITGFRPQLNQWSVFGFQNLGFAKTSNEA
jgi:hypothetical protein